VLRTRRPGDRFQPLGLEAGSQTVADFMINAKLPERARDGWPLLCRNGEVLWVPGLRIGHRYRLRPETGSVLHLQVARRSLSPASP
jgi:tRNA(Ile)-lysidine synthase